MNRHCLRAFTLMIGVFLLTPAFAEEFSARFGRVPVDSRTQATVAGLGHATAELDGDRLEVAGSFEGLLGAATIANLHMSAAVGVRGPVVHELTVTEQANGEVSGSVRLSGDEIAALQAGRLYIQIHSASAPDGNLWGWLFME